MITNSFISSPLGMSDIGAVKPAPLFRRRFTVAGKAEGTLLVTGLGFYRLFVNGREITKGILSPYISTPDAFVYFDEYDLAPYLRDGENVIGIMLGNGTRNYLGNMICGFLDSPFRGAPCTALVCEIRDKNGETCFEADERFVTHSSPILFDDLKVGEIYDARLESGTEGWTEADFDDSAWVPAVKTEAPAGEQRLCAAPPVVSREVLRPVKTWDEDGAIIYDFGKNGAGQLSFDTSAPEGTHIVIDFAEILVDGKFYNDTICCTGEDAPLPYRYQTLDYTARGGKRHYAPSFTYEGFRYARVRGVKKEDFSPVFTLYSSKMRERGTFTSSSKVLNALHSLTREASLSNLLHVPTDCPHREKAGWTADAALSMPHFLLNLDADALLTEWMRSVAASQRENGRIPGFVPNSGADRWYESWAGPAWDIALVEVPFRLWQYRGDLTAAKIAAPTWRRYIGYVMAHRDERELVHFGLGDWLPPHGFMKAPVEFTDTVMCLDFARKAACLCRELGEAEDADFLASAADDLLRALRRETVYRGMALGRCQTTQAMGIYYGIFEEKDVDAATDLLLRYIDEEDGHLDCGVLGVRVLFRVLSEHGHADLAYKMITRPDAPSYGNMVARGETTLAEDFNGEGERINSRNHHFLGDVSAWMFECVCGLRVNPFAERNLRGAAGRVGADVIEISPAMPEDLGFAECSHETKCGTVKVKLTRTGDGEITLEATVPEGITGTILPPVGYAFDGAESFEAKSGKFVAKKH
ncbi:MAG: family 78 glycoside hydrolase catalytic domain [Clostridia bacterium]|nr:family 78 glycoside hydrolase catalytic domain [Clostridia bacterium]